MVDEKFQEFVALRSLLLTVKAAGMTKAVVLKEVNNIYGEMAPESYSNSNKDVMSTHKGIFIDQEVAKRLQKEEVTADFTSPNFHGEVWWDKQMKAFRCAVFIDGVYRETFKGTPEEIMRSACEKYQPQKLAEMKEGEKEEKGKGKESTVL